MSDSPETIVNDINTPDNTLGSEDAFYSDMPSDDEIMEALNAKEGDSDNPSTPSSDDNEPEESVEEEAAPAEDSEENKGDEEADSEEKPVESDSYEVKINGEEVKVSLQELKNNYSGEKEVARRFTELDKDKKTFYSEKTEVETYVNNFASKMKDGDVVGAFGYFASFAEIPPHMVKEQLVAALRPEIERRSHLTAEQLEGESLKAQNEYLKSLNESETKRRDEEQSKTDLQSQINSVREAHSITDNEWEAAFSALDNEVPKDQIITVDQVKERVVTLKANDTASKVLSEFEGIPDTAKTSLVDVILKNPDFDETTLKEIVQESIEASRKNGVENDLKKKLSKSNSTKVAVGDETNTDLSELGIEPMEDWD